MIISIDGLCVNGKTTLAQKISKELNFKNFNTGAIYRCIALEICNKELNINKMDMVVNALKSMDVDFVDEKVILNGEDVSEKIRTDRISFLSTEWALIPEIKELVREIQRAFIKKYNTVMEGRDIGTRIAPKADVKFYLYSDIETRIKRKALQNPDLKEDYIRDNIEAIDKLDEKGNFVKPEDAIEIKTDDMTIDEVYNLMMKKIKEKMKI